ncbi:cysteine--tRNA ligase [Candidatus Saccharibacteria bacterium]|nr:cysteine--tRNA ligase [Candidatus Saccharibacteria bacterium]
MKLYNTLTRNTEEFVPQDPQNVKVYTCGPTVYGYQHIGNFAAYIYWDTLIRTLQSNDFKVNRILNITDVGHLTSDADDGQDKLEKGAKREGKTVWQIAEYYTDDFLVNFKQLNLIDPAKITKATNYVEAGINLIDELTKKGYTYETADGIYYDTSKFPTYANFAHLDLENLKAGARVDFNPEKRNPSDFALWKFIKPNEDHAMRWDYLGKPGYPGWHLECSSIIHAELGEPIDIHTGGIDHIPVHHTNEIAQSEAAFDKPLSKFWLHNNHITVDGTKISKSLGNVYTFKDLEEKGFTHLDYRMWVLQGHYQSERNFTFDDLSAAKQRLLNYRNFAALRWQNQPTNQQLLDETVVKITTFINDNLNTSGALAELDQVLDQTAPNDNFLGFLDDVFGLQLIESTHDISSEQKQSITDQQTAREAKDWAKADEIRNQVETTGIGIRSTPTGPIWQYKN